MSNSSIWPIDLTLSSATMQGQSGPGSDGNEWILCIFQSLSITGALPRDCLMFIQNTHWGGDGGEGLTPTAEMQSVYSTALVDWAQEQIG